MPKLASSSQNTSKQNSTTVGIEKHDDDCNQLPIENLSDPLPLPPSPAPSTRTDKNKPYLGKIIIIIGGNSIGLKGRVTRIENRGWWTIDNPILAGKKVTAKLCRLVSSMPPSHVKRYEALVGSLHGVGTQFGPRVELSDDSKDGKRPKRRTSFKASYSSVKKYKLRGHFTTSKKRGESLTFPFVSSDRTTGTTNRLSDPIMWEAGNTKSETFLPRKKASFRHTQSKHPYLLHPLLLDPQDNQRYFQNGESLSYTHPDSVIEVFNRKTGRVMRGEYGIKVNDLATALRSHAEYEPVIHLSSPDTTCNKKIGSSKVGSMVNHNRRHMTRIARSSKNTQLSAFIRPQISVCDSVLEGCVVVVNTGPYRGLIGKVESCSPGGWYMISDSMDNNDQSPYVAVHSQNLKVVFTKDETKMKNIEEQGYWNKDDVSTSTEKTNYDEVSALCLKRPEVEPTPSWIGVLRLEKEKQKKFIQDRSNSMTLSKNRKNDDVIVNAQAALKVQQLTEQMLGVV